MTAKHSLLRSVLLGALCLGSIPELGAAQALNSTLTARCVGGAIGCSQADFFLTLDDPGASTALDFLRLSLTVPGWLFADPNLGEAEDATGEVHPLCAMSPFVLLPEVTRLAGYSIGVIWVTAVAFGDRLARHWRRRRST